MSTIINQPKSKLSERVLLLAHGAGAGMDSAYLNAMAERICSQGVTVVRFEFPYMQKRRQTNLKRPPDRMPTLLDCFQQMVEQHGGAANCVAAGKSMGGRVASMLLAEDKVAAAVSFGYPFHPPGKPDKVRRDHWAAIQRPWLILQGTRDAFGKPDEVATYGLPDSSQLVWLEDGDHDFKTRKSSGLKQVDNIHRAAKLTAEFVMGLDCP